MNAASSSFSSLDAIEFDVDLKAMLPVMITLACVLLSSPTLLADDGPPDAPAETAKPVEKWSKMTGERFDKVKDNEFFQLRLKDDRWALYRAYKKSDAQDGILIALVVSQMKPVKNYSHFRYRRATISPRQREQVESMTSDDLQKRSVYVLEFTDNEPVDEKGWLKIATYAALWRN
ncbi:hypothetical protein LOC71_22275 [Rhodopirellula sp. JC740]|uniref:Uncharacterized protein n=1 Tax=Rhodopirellula halodulae TaxID=2894198 RepID=A0ABS8NQA7_9BACT|nr:hypothetical protein [Rhodopirellula sp. JC740]MCC9645013.1 hypothetical protein [Rhodopirellula sp. JC740]